MKNILIDLNILLDYYEYARREKYPESVKVFEYLKYKDFAFIASSSIDNFEFIKYDDITKAKPSLTKKQKLEIVHNFIREIVSFFKIAKTPSYTEIDYEDIEDSLIIASAKAINALVLTRDEKMLKKYPDLSISPQRFLEIYSNKEIEKIPMLDLSRETFYMYDKIEKRMDDVIRKSNFILGPEVKELEQKVASYIGTKYAVGCSSGTDALVLSLRALAIKNKNQEYWDKEDLIITTPFTFTATGDSILRAGATPLFVDIDLDSYNINPELVEKAIKKYGKRIKGIVPVHLYGQPCNMDQIIKIAKENDLFIVEDCAQSFGAKWDGKYTGSFGDTGCFSFFPSKNLGGFGDGGMITTNDEKLYELISMLIKHGGKDKYNVDHIGYNARLDTLQAAILLAKMEYIDEFTQKRRKIAKFYDENLQNIDWIITPKVLDKAYHVYHQYTIRIKDKNREEVQKTLLDKGIQTMVYYPVPLHKMKVFIDNRREIFGDLKNSETASQSVLSLPIEPLYGEEEVRKVVNAKEANRQNLLELRDK
jgi:dTDP-4-amino-4,6-dideoxygalactose transaminase